MLRKFAVFTILSLCFAFVLMPIVAAFAADVAPAPPDPWFTPLQTAMVSFGVLLLGTVGSILVALRPWIVARATAWLQAAALDKSYLDATKRDLVDRAIASGNALYPDAPASAADYVAETVPETLAALGVNAERLEDIVNARKKVADAEHRSSGVSA